MAEVAVVYEDDKKRGQWKISVFESLVIGTDGIVRGYTIRVITKEKPIRLPRPVQRLYLLEFPSEWEGTRTLCDRKRNTEIHTRKASFRNTALDSRCKSRIMLDS